MNQEARTIIDALRWIPCEERLPEKTGNYLCTIAIRGAAPAFRMIGHFYHSDSGTGRWTDDNKLQQTIAWMPLPEPYEPDDGKMEEEHEQTAETGGGCSFR